MSCRVSTHSEGDSDSDWDDDDDFASKKITIKIKPIAQVTPNKISASVDELRATVGTWKSLANINLVKPNSRRHNNINNHINQNNHNQNPHNHNDPHQQHNQNSPISESAKLPVAFAIQECLNAKLQKGDNRASIMETLSSSVSNGMNISSNGEIAHNPTDGMAKIKQNTNLNQLSLIGHLKMAVHPQLASMPSPMLDRYLDVELVSSIPWDHIRLNQQFVSVSEPTNNNNPYNDGSSSDGTTTPVNTYPLTLNPLKAQPTINLFNNQQTNEPIQPFVSSISSSTTNHNPISKKLSINMNTVQSYVKQQYQKQPNQKYFLVPELLEYVIGSQHKQDDNNDLQNNSEFDHKQLSSSSSSSSNIHLGLGTQNGSARVCPLQAQAHWLCDLSVTKVRFDIQFLENSVDHLSTNDIQNLKISFNVDGGVTSCQSKPEANWDAINSKLTWSSASLNELIQKSTTGGLISCLAKFYLSDGPSSPSDVNIEFSIAGKTLTGTKVILNGSNFRIAKQKYEVRTGAFKCSTSPCI